MGDPKYFVSWNPTADWLRRLGAFQRADEHNQSGISPGGRPVLEFNIDWDNV